MGRAPQPQGRMTYLLWVPALLWMGLIFYVSSLPRVDMPELITRATPLPLDLLGHLGGYALLAVALMLGLRSQPFRRALLLALVIAAVYGVSDEVHQAFVPGRVASAGDAAADATGALLGLAAVATARAAIARFRRGAPAARHYRAGNPG